MKKSELKQLIREEIKLLKEKETVKTLKAKGVDVYTDKDTGDIVYISMLGNGMHGLYNLSGEQLAYEKRKSDIFKAYSLKKMR